MAYDPTTNPAVPPFGEVVDPTLDPFARREELLADYQQASLEFDERLAAARRDPDLYSHSGELGRIGVEREKHARQLVGPMLNNLFDRMHAQGMVQVGAGGAETIQLHAPHDSLNAGQLTFTRGGVAGNGVVMTFAENAHIGWEGNRVQRGHTLMYDLASSSFKPFAGGPKFTDRGLSSGADTRPWLNNILNGRTDSEFAADEIADKADREQREREAADRHAAEVAASLKDIEGLRAASMLGSLSLKVMRAKRRHNQNYGD